MGKIYKVEIGFSKEKHCLQCPCRDKNDDSCNIQGVDRQNLQFASWENQMLGCPLRFIKEVN